MSWAKLDDQFPDHPKVRSLGVFGIGLQAAAICYCARYLTDGFLSWSVADQLIASVMAPFTLPDGQIVTPAVTSGMSGDDAASWDWKARMVKAGLWERSRGGFLVHDYLDYNPTKATVLEERAKTAARVAKHRGNGNAAGNAVTNGGVTGAPSPSPSPREKASSLSRSEPTEPTNDALTGEQIKRDVGALVAGVLRPKA